MRHLMTSFLALHWAVFFALSGFLCVGGGLPVALALVGLDGTQSSGQSGLATAPLAVAFLLVAALFCWVLVESCLGEADHGVVKIAFVSAGAVLSLVFIAGALRGAGDLSGVILSLSALIASYLAALGERLTAMLRDEARSAQATAGVRAMARDAANTSLLNRISGRPDLWRER